MAINRQFFFDQTRATLIDGAFKQAQVDGLADARAGPDDDGSPTVQPEQVRKLVDGRTSGRRHTRCSCRGGLGNVVHARDSVSPPSPSALDLTTPRTPPAEIDVSCRTRRLQRLQRQSRREA